jgi:ribonuclease HI
MNKIIFLRIVVVVSVLMTISSVWKVIDIYYTLSKEMDYARSLEDVCNGSVMEKYTVRNRLFKYLNSNKIFSMSPKLAMTAFIVPLGLFAAYIILQYDWKNSNVSVLNKLKSLQMPTFIYFIPFMYLVGSIVIAQKFCGLMLIQAMTEYSKKKQIIVKYLDYLQETNRDPKSSTYAEYMSLINLLRKRILHVDDLESYTDVDTVMAKITSEELFDYIKFINISIQNISRNQLEIINTINLLRDHTSSDDTWKRIDKTKTSSKFVDMKWTSVLSPEEQSMLIQTVESFGKDEVHNYEVISTLQEIANPGGQNNDYQYLYNLSYSIPVKIDEKYANENEVKDALNYLSIGANGNSTDEVKSKLTEVSYFVYTFIMISCYLIIHFIYKLIPNPMSTMVLGMFVFVLVFIYLWVVNFMSNV